jgi:thioesterase domain-containing protein
MFGVRNLSPRKNGELAPARSADRAERAYVAPRDLTETLLADIWESVLGKTPVGITHTFAELGGTSRTARLMFDRVAEACGLPVPRSASWPSITIKDLSALLCTENRALLALPYRRLGPGQGQPFFFLHGDFIGGGLYCLNLARAVGGDHTFYALPPYPGESPILESIEDMATVHLDTVRRLQPAGPYRLGGFCAGALVAFEVARRLQAQGERVERLVLVAPRPWSDALLRRRLSMGVGRLLGLAPEVELTAFMRLVDRLDRRNLARHTRPAHRTYAARLRRWLHRPLDQQLTVLVAKLREDLATIARRWSPSTQNASTRRAPTAEETRRGRLWTAYRRANCAYILRKYAGELTLVWPEHDVHRFGYPAGPWRRVVRHVDLHIVPGEHSTSVTKHVASVGKCVRTCLEVGPPPAGVGGSALS